MTELPYELINEILSFSSFEEIEVSLFINKTWRSVAEFYITQYMNDVKKNPSLSMIFSRPLSFKLLSNLSIKGFLSNKDIVFHEAVKTQPVPILQWLELKGFEKYDEISFANAASSNSLEVLIWLKKRGCKWDEKTLIAATCRRRNCLSDRVIIWLIQNHAPCSDEAVQNALKNQAPYIYQLVRDFGFHGDEKRPMMNGNPGGAEHTVSKENEIIMEQSEIDPMQKRMHEFYNICLIKAADYIVTQLLPHEHMKDLVLLLREEIKRYIKNCCKYSLSSETKKQSEKQLIGLLQYLTKEYNLIINLSYEDSAVVNECLFRVKQIEKELNEPQSIDVRGTLVCCPNINERKRRRFDYKDKSKIWFVCNTLT